MRLEKIVSKALKNVDNDSYVLSLMVAKRTKELNQGSEPKIEIKKEKYKYPDIALMEIAEGKIQLESIL